MLGSDTTVYQLMTLATLKRRSRVIHQACCKMDVQTREGVILSCDATATTGGGNFEAQI